MLIIIWIDEEIYNRENLDYVKELEKLGYEKIRLFQKVNEAFDYMKSILFEETKIIVGEKLYNEFVNTFKEFILDIYFVPKIIIFTRFNQDYKNLDNKFFSFEGIATILDEVKNFLIKDNNIINQNISNNENIFLNTFDESNEYGNNDDDHLIFEYIDSKDKLFLPLFFKTLIEKASNENMEEYIKSLYNIYYKDENIKKLLEQILYLKNIPIEILSKYFARLYTLNTSFQKNLNKDLIMKKKEKYLPYIKTFYEGVKLRSLPLANNIILYRAGNLSNDEMNKIEIYKNKKIEGLPGLIVFSKTFLSFSKSIEEAKKFFKYANKKLSKVLFKLINDNKQGYNLATHGDIEKISYYPIEQEVLFFPFSSFEIQGIKPIYINREKIYEIQLLYLGKYLKDIDNDKNIIINENEITDTKFKKELIEVGLIKTEKIKKISPKILYNNYKQYEKEINKNKKDNNNINYKNIIIGEINIGIDFVNENIRIINSFENYKKEHEIKDKEDDFKNENEKEIKDNIEIKINKKIIPFSYYHKFEKEGKYNIQYSFKNNLSKTNYMFYECNSLTNLNFSKFNTQDVTNMSCMFRFCNLLTNLNLFNFNTQNVTNMSYMFSGCKSLQNLNLTNFNTQNVNNMSYMFNHCKLLTNLNLSNFNTQNVNDMSWMFSDCNSLTNLDLSNFNAQNVIDMSQMFYNCKKLQILNLSNIIAQNTTNMSQMFYNCNSLKTLNLSNFNTQKVTNMSKMFYECKSLETINLSNFNTQNVTNMSNMFNNCNSLKTINLSNFDTQNVTNMSYMFNNCSSLKTIYLSNFDT